MGTDTLFEQVQTFVARRTRTPAERVTPETELFRDLGVDGADGPELIEAFAKQFSVDLTGIDYRLHFGPEASLNPVALVRAILRPRGFHPITVADLVLAARTRRWH